MLRKSRRPYRMINESNGVSDDTIEKLSVVLTRHYYIHEADMIERAIFGDNISVYDFKESFNDFKNYNGDEDEYVPGIFNM